MRPLALLLEDNSIVRQERAESLFRKGLAVLTAGSVVEARRHLHASPSLDILICDINLDVKDSQDKSGFDFAEETRRRFENVTIVGYSAHFEATRFRKTERALATFSNMFSRGKEKEFDHFILEFVGSLSKKFERADQEERAFEQLVEIIGKSFLSDKDAIGGLRAFKSHVSSANQADLNFTDDFALAMSGYRLLIVSAPSDHKLPGDGADIKLAAPLPIWCRYETGVWKMEVFAHHQFAASEETEEAGVSAILEQISTAAENPADASKDREHRQFASRIIASVAR